jgi:hypothetical protein
VRSTLWQKGSKILKRSKSRDPHELNSLRKKSSSEWMNSRSERRNSLPLSERARVEVYLPDLPKASYQDLLEALDREFTYTFGGCTIMRGLDGSYLSKLGIKMRDRVHLIYTDVAVAFDQHFQRISRYTDRLREAAFEALEEEAILVVVLKVYHSE